MGLPEPSRNCRRFSRYPATRIAGGQAQTRQTRSRRAPHHRLVGLTVVSCRARLHPESPACFFSIPDQGRERSRCQRQSQRDLVLDEFAAAIA